MSRRKWSKFVDNLKIGTLSNLDSKSKWKRWKVDGVLVFHRYKKQIKFFKEELILILLQLFHKTEKEETYPNSFHIASITQVTKADKDTTEKENYRSIFLWT